jgi:hypothetical protein
MCTRQALLVALAVLIIPGTAAAVTILVPHEQPTIQQGIDAAAEGDTVLVAPGTYDGALNRDLDFGGTNISVISEGGPMAATIDCEGLGRGFFFHSGEDTTSVVFGFTIADAFADTGAGAYCSNGSSPRFMVCAFNYCTAQTRGGGLCCNASSPVVRHCQFMVNAAEDVTRRAAYGGGISCLSGSSPLIADTDFSANEAHDGGGLYSYYSSPQFARCEFVENLAADYGHGAGASLSFSDGAAFTECIFRANGVPTCSGGGIHVSSSTITVTDCVFVDNIGGVCAGMRMTGASTSTVTGCAFVGNTANWGAAGGLACYSDATPTVTNCTFVGNHKHQVWCNDASPTLEYCILAFSPTGLAVLCDTGTETPSIHHCFVFGNAGGDVLCGGNYHDIEYVDPRLCDVEGGDVTLCADSPCLPGVTWTSLVGAEAEGCAACGSAVEQRTWGGIKAMYR